MNKDKIILDLCGGTGEWARPYKEAGYTVHTITLPDYDIIKHDMRGEGTSDYLCFYHESFYESGVKLDFSVNPPKITNILEIPIESIYGILAAPPCTQFSIARNDKTAKTPRNLKEGLKTIDACMSIVRACLLYHYRKDDKGLKFWALENPTTGYLERFLGKAPFKFQPCDFGDPYTKRTSLWGEFNFPKKTPVEPLKQNFVKYAATDDEVKKDKLSRIPEGYQKKTGYDTRKIIRSITPKGFAKAFFEANR